MRSPQRQPDPGVIDRLLEEPWQVELFQAVRLLARWLQRHGGGGSLESSVRFENSLSLAFPTSEIESLALDALEDGSTRVRLRTAVMGLLGVNGTLPLHYTERIGEWEHATRDEGPRAFYDAFSNRQVALFYRAWCKYRVRGGPDERNRDRFLAQLAALGGVAGHAQLEAGLSSESLAYFAAQLRSRVVSAGLVAGVLGEYLQVPVKVEQFTGGSDMLGLDQRSKLGANNCEVGIGATLGDRLPRPELGIRIRVGPVPGTVFQRFLPGASGARAIAALLDQFAIDIPYRELQVILRREDVIGASLDGLTRLGLDGFLSTRANRRDRDDVCYLL
ncbi:type VI secretion system baseplate subunit TssG [Telluria aromaticivorans]|uniref:Type VI secretion system baseplate subunit TssG n=1 Tax=Telluria aromaticivorans TaxID=2725995 RepID=A0A7Y2K316_9BURK|nr:type VI secretion system baseplate subunit TssG [Telluria aromaticivorans]NNG24514.1 type VI secretion system baseplate subunit TssG [Telluria aromaticivorans]